MTLGTTQFDLYEKEKSERGFVRTSGVHLSLSALVFSAVCLVVLVTATGLLVWYLPDRNCRDESIDVPDATTAASGTPTSSPTSTKDPNIIWDDPRLPDTLLPLHYDLEMTTDLDNFTFNGTISVTILCRKPTNLLVLNSNKLEILRETARIEDTGGSGGMPSITRISVDVRNQYLNVMFDQDLQENSVYKFVIMFSGILNDNIKGFYRSSYTLPGGDGDKGWLAVTFFSPTNARMAFPCFDDPGLKANLTLTMTHKQDYQALGNMPTEGATTSLDGWVTTRFATSPKIATYLVCFAVLKFQSVEITSRSNVTIRGWARPDAMDSLEFGLNMTARTLDFYIEHIDVDFPLPKIDVVAVPDFEASAMENWGLITYRETALLNKAGSTSEATTGSQGFVIAHEMGHQYFGNLVTHAWWEHILLKEGGATYLAYKSLPVVQPTWNYEDLFVIDQMATAMPWDALPNPRPVQKEVATPTEIANSFDRAITYNKGPSILRMCENIIGEPAFKTGLQIYMKKYAFGTATNDDFWDCLQEAVDMDDTITVSVPDVMHTWVLQPGFPVVNITRIYENKDEITFKAEQTRFLISKDENAEENTMWIIPLWFRTETIMTNTEPVWMNNQPDISHQILGSDDADWLLVNPCQFGYYRVNYDPTNWQLLIGQLLSNHTVIPVSSRAGLIDDSFTLARAGDLGYSVALGITKYLEHERDYVPWALTTMALSYLDSNLLRTVAYGSFIKYMRKQITPLYSALGWSQEGTHLQILTRNIALGTACFYGLPECEDQSLYIFHEWMTNQTNNSIPVNYKSTVYCTAIATGRNDEFDFALTRYKASADAAERAVLLSSLACSRQTWALTSLLQYTMDDAETIKAQDVPVLMGDVASNPLGTSLAWDFFRENYDVFRDRFGDSLFHFGRIVQGVTSSFTTEFQLEELEKFMAEHPDQGTGAAAFSNAVENVKTRIRWAESHYEEVKNWLDQTVAA